MTPNKQSLHNTLSSLTDEEQRELIARMLDGLSLRAGKPVEEVLGERLDALRSAPPIVVLTTPPPKVLKRLPGNVWDQLTLFNDGVVAAVTALQQGPPPPSPPTQPQAGPSPPVEKQRRAPTALRWAAICTACIVVLLFSLTSFTKRSAARMEQQAKEMEEHIATLRTQLPVTQGDLAREQKDLAEFKKTENELRESAEAATKKVKIELEDIKAKSQDAQRQVALLRKTFNNRAIPVRSDTALSKPELKEVTNSIGMTLVRIPAGELVMGSPKNEKGRYDDEGPQHRVVITKPFYIGKYEVTQNEYEAIMGENPSSFTGPNNPVENVSWNDAVELCRKLSEKEGREYGLPTEAEWEYACRAGSTARFYYGNDEDQLGDYAWYWRNSDSKTHPVGQKKPNAWGLYDMHGNVWEWCADWYDEDYYKNSPLDDPKGPGRGSFRVLRGGSWSSSPLRIRSAYRYYYKPAYRRSNRGFRVVLRARGFR